MIRPGDEDRDRPDPGKPWRESQDLGRRWQRQLWQRLGVELKAHKGAQLWQHQISSVQRAVSNILPSWGYTVLGLDASENLGVRGSGGPEDRRGLIDTEAKRDLH